MDTGFYDISTRYFDKRLEQIVDFLKSGRTLCIHELSQDDIDNTKDNNIKRLLIEYMSLEKKHSPRITVMAIQHTGRINYYLIRLSDMQEKHDEVTITINQLYEFLNVIHYRLTNSVGTLIPGYGGYLIKG